MIAYFTIIVIAGEQITFRASLRIPDSNPRGTIKNATGGGKYTWSCLKMYMYISRVPNNTDPAGSRLWI